MKVFIVFLAFAVIFTGALVFGTDMQRYMLLQKRLKTLSEDCAEAAALCIDPEQSQALGQAVIDVQKGSETARMLCEKAASSGGFGKYAAVTVEIEHVTESSVGARVSWHGSDIFRSSFIKKTDVQRYSVYSWDQ